MDCCAASSSAPRKRHASDLAALEAAGMCPPKRSALMLAPAGLGDLDLVDRIRRAGYEAFDVEMPGMGTRQGFIKRFD